MKKLKFSDCIGDCEEGIFYRNKRDLTCADPGVLYVSEKDDPVNGGWFYTYFTGDVQLEEGEYRRAAYKCYRSRDLEKFEPAGKAGKGACLVVRDDAWAEKYFWAPEVAFDKSSGKYYIYFSAGAKPGNEHTEYTSETDDRWACLYLGIGVSDSPMGPFEFVTSENCPGGVNLNGDVITRFNPPINFERKLNMPHYWSAIDVSPFFAPDGGFYLYFAKHVDNFHQGICIYGMKMKDMITPDYSTLTQLTKSCYRTVYQPGDYTTAQPLCRDMDEGGVNEGPFMTFHDGKYYLTYSRYGYGARAYDISMAVSDSPLGQFVKIPHGEGNPALGLNPTNDFMAGNGHHNFAYAGDEVIAFYHSHKDPVKNTDEQGRFLGRVFSVDKIKYVYSPRYGFDLMQGNGPTASPQPLAEVNASYVNAANKAQVLSNALSGEKYLTDDIFTAQPFAEYMEAVFDGQAEISLQFADPVKIKAVMVYNAYSYKYAFSCVDKVIITMSDGKRCCLEDVRCNPADVNHEKRFMRQGGAAIAVLERPVEAVKAEFFIGRKYCGDCPEIRISDIKILAEKSQTVF